MWRTDSWQNEWFDHQTVWNNWTWIKILSYILTVAHYSSHEIPCTQQPDQALASKNVLNHLLPNGWLDWMEDNLHIAAQRQLHSRHFGDDLWLCRFLGHPKIPWSTIQSAKFRILMAIWPFSVPVEKSRAHVVPSDLQVYSLLATWHRVYHQVLGLTV